MRDGKSQIVITMVFLFLKHLPPPHPKKKECSKRIIRFITVFFFVTMACCVARKSYSGRPMILRQPVERKSTWMQMQVERTTQSV